jgi:hypothetical protein
MHEARAAAAGRVELHAHHEAAFVPAGHGQGVLAHHPVGQVDVDVRPRLEVREDRSGVVAELEQIDVLRDAPDGHEAKVEGDGWRHRGCSCLRSP